MKNFFIKSIMFYKIILNPFKQKKIMENPKTKFSDSLNNVNNSLNDINDGLDGGKVINSDLATAKVFLNKKSIPLILLVPSCDFVVKDVPTFSNSGLVSTSQEKYIREKGLNIYEILKLKNKPRYIRGVFCSNCGLMSNKYALKLFCSDLNFKDIISLNETPSLVRPKINQTNLNNSSENKSSDIEISPEALQVVTNLSHVPFIVNKDYLNYILNNMAYLVDSGILPVLKRSKSSEKSSQDNDNIISQDNQIFISQDDNDDNPISQDDFFEKKIDLSQGEKEINFDTLKGKPPEAIEHLKWLSNLRSCKKYNENVNHFFRENRLFHMLGGKDCFFTSKGILQGAHKKLKEAIYDHPSRAILSLKGISDAYNRHLDSANTYQNLPLFFQIILDTRGRMYYIGDFGPLQLSFATNLIVFAKSCKVSSNSIEEYEFFVGIGKMIKSQESSQASFDFVNKYKKEILDSLNNYLWLIFKEPSLALILQLKKYFSKSKQQRIKGVSLFIKIPNDATNSVVQICSALTKDSDGAIFSNLIPAPEDDKNPNLVVSKDYYTHCLEKCREDLKPENIIDKFHSKCVKLEEKGFIYSKSFVNEEHIFKDCPGLKDFSRLTRSIFKPLLMRASYGQGKKKGAEYLLKKFDFKIAQENLQLNNESTEEKKYLINDLNYVNEESKILNSKNFKFFKISLYSLLPQFSRHIEKNIFFDKSSILRLEGFESLEDNLCSNLFIFTNLDSFEISVDSFLTKYKQCEAGFKPFVIDIKNKKKTQKIILDLTINIILEMVQKIEKIKQYYIKQEQLSNFKDQLKKGKNKNNQSNVNNNDQNLINICLKTLNRLIEREKRFLILQEFESYNYISNDALWVKFAYQEIYSILYQKAKNNLQNEQINQSNSQPPKEEQIEISSLLEPILDQKYRDNLEKETIVIDQLAKNPISLQEFYEGLSELENKMKIKKFYYISNINSLEIRTKWLADFKKSLNNRFILLQSYQYKKLFVQSMIDIIDISIRKNNQSLFMVFNFINTLAYYVSVKNKPFIVDCLKGIKYQSFYPLMESKEILFSCYESEKTKNRKKNRKVKLNRASNFSDSEKTSIAATANVFQSIDSELMRGTLSPFGPDIVAEGHHDSIDGIPGKVAITTQRYKEAFLDTFYSKTKKESQIDATNNFRLTKDYPFYLFKKMLFSNLLNIVEKNLNNKLEQQIFNFAETPTLAGILEIYNNESNTDLLRKPKASLPVKMIELRELYDKLEKDLTQGKDTKKHRDTDLLQTLLLIYLFLSKIINERKFDPEKLLKQSNPLF